MTDCYELGNKHQDDESGDNDGDNDDDGGGDNDGDNDDDYGGVDGNNAAQHDNRL